MISGKGVTKPRVRPISCTSSYWLRAPAGGLLRTFRQTGDLVASGDLMGMVSDPFGENEVEVLAQDGGIIVGRTNLPVVNEGDALFHVATPPSAAVMEGKVEALAEQLEGQPLFDEDEII